MDSNTLSTQEQREHLSWLALNATRDEARVAAHRALQQLDQALGVQTKLGPGEPLTREGRIFRLSLLMEACGKDVAEESMRRVFHAVENGTAIRDLDANERSQVETVTSEAAELPSDPPYSRYDPPERIPVVSDALPIGHNEVRESVDHGHDSGGTISILGADASQDGSSVQVVAEETHALDHVPIPGEPASPPPLLRPEKSEDDREELALRPSVSMVEGGTYES